MHLSTVYTICSRNIIVKPVEPDYFHQILNHLIHIFVRDEPLAHCFPPCTTGKREDSLRKYVEIHLRSGFSVMALDGNQVVGACLSKLLTRDEYFNFDISPVDDPSKLSFI